MNKEILSLEHEKKNLLIQLQRFQNRLTSDDDRSSPDTKIDDETSQLSSTRQLPSIYRRTFERQIISFENLDEKHDDDVEFSQDCDEKNFHEIIQELNQLSLDQKDFLNFLIRTIEKFNGYLFGSKKLVTNSLISISGKPK